MIEKNFSFLVSDSSFPHLIDPAPDDLLCSRYLSSPLQVRGKHQPHIAEVKTKHKKSRGSKNSNPSPVTTVSQTTSLLPPLLQLNSPLRLAMWREEQSFLRFWAVLGDVALLVALVARAWSAAGTAASSASAGLLLALLGAVAAEVTRLTAVVAVARVAAAGSACGSTCATATSARWGACLGAVAAQVAGLATVVAAARGDLSLGAVLGHVALLVALVARDRAGCHDVQR